MEVWYSVTAKFENIAVRNEYLAWLAGGHMQAVIAGGATQARSVVVDGDELVVQTQYVFPGKVAFDRYVDLYAPPLRLDGQKRFPAERGVSFTRQLGVIAASFQGGIQSTNA